MSYFFVLFLLLINILYRKSSTKKAPIEEVSFDDGTDKEFRLVILARVIKAPVRFELTNQGFADPSIRPL